MFWTKGAELHNVPLSDELFVTEQKEDTPEVQSVQPKIYDMGFSHDFDSPKHVYMRHIILLIDF